MRKYFFLLLALASLTASNWLYINTTSAFTPASLTGLQAWWDGNDVNNGSNPSFGTKFSAWNDKSGHAYDLAQATSGRQYKMGTANSKPAAYSDCSGGENWMTVSRRFINSGTATSIILIHKADATHATWIAWNDKTSGDIIQFVGGTDIAWLSVGGAGEKYSGVTAANTTYMTRAAYDGGGYGSLGSYRMLLNEVALSTDGSYGGDGDHSTMFLGGDGGDPGWCGYVLDVIIADGISDGDAALVLAYEKAKWGF